MGRTIVELRRYTLHPGRRDTLIALFERVFIEPQETTGMRVVGHFRDLDNPDLFVWLRDFATMQTRKDALAAFYGSAIWKEHRSDANATMADSDNVLLLRPARPSSGFSPRLTRRPPLGEQPPTRVYLCVVNMLQMPARKETIEAFERDASTTLAQQGGRLCAYFVTEQSANDYPALPVREGENAFVWMAEFPDMEHTQALKDGGWRAIGPLAPSHALSTEIHRLAPAARSLLR
jgi:hypothetical protein